VLPTEENIREHIYTEATDWIYKNVPENETVFHNIWDIGSILFYLDDSHNYIIGLDPTFMYEYDPHIHQKWKEITLGNSTENISEIITIFGSRTVILEARESIAYKKFLNNLIESELFEEVANNGIVYVFHCTEECNKLSN
jgi:hypothetical protein